MYRYGLDMLYKFERQFATPEINQRFLDQYKAVFEDRFDTSAEFKITPFGARRKASTEQQICASSAAATIFLKDYITVSVDYALNFEIV